MAAGLCAECVEERPTTPFVMADDRVVNLCDGCLPTVSREQSALRFVRAVLRDDRRAPASGKRKVRRS